MRPQYVMYQSDIFVSDRQWAILFRNVISFVFVSSQYTLHYEWKPADVGLVSWFVRHDLTSTTDISLHVLFLVFKYINIDKPQSTQLTGMVIMFDQNPPFINNPLSTKHCGTLWWNYDDAHTATEANVTGRAHVNTCCITAGGLLTMFGWTLLVR